MNDQISRQKLIEYVQLQIDHYKEGGIKSLDKEERGVVRGLEMLMGIIHDYECELSQPLAEPYVPLSEVYKVIAGHSDYHGDDILAALTCIAEGKDANPVRPLPKSQWIPCSKKRPSYSQRCFITASYNGLTTTFKAIYWESHWETPYGSIGLKYVTAWMPAEPYKGAE